MFICVLTFSCLNYRFDLFPLDMIKTILKWYWFYESHFYIQTLFFQVKREKNSYSIISFIGFYTRTCQKFCNNLVTYLFYSSSYNKSSLALKVEVIVLHCLKPLFCQFFDPMLIPVLVFWGFEHLHWSFHLSLVVEGLQVEEVSHELG